MSNTNTPKNTPAAKLVHNTGCPERRCESVDHGGTTVTHCLDCGAHMAAGEDGRALPLPHVTGALAAIPPDTGEDLMRKAGDN